MSQYYTKINTCFKRDLDHNSKLYNCIMPEWGLTTPEFELLKDLKWEATEKIDGTNMSYHYSYRQKSCRTSRHPRPDGSNPQKS